MEVKKTIENIKPELERIITYTGKELAAFRTGRASISLIEDIMVDYYGARTPLKQLAAINSPETRVIVVQPWDKNSLEVISKAISEARLGFNPVVKGTVIQLIVPSLTEERRKELMKLVRQKIEEARIAIRHQREEAWKEIQNLAKGKFIGEDDKFRGKDELQRVIDEYNRKIMDMERKKEEEILRS